MLKKEVNMLSGSIVKGLFSIAIPIMIMNVLQSLFNIIDMTILKQFGNDELAVGAVGVSGTLISLITGLLIGISAGANVVIAKHIGRGDQESVDRAVGTSILFSIIGGFVLLVIGVSFAEVFLKIISCADVLLPKGALYFRLYFLGIPILMVYNFTAAILRSQGDSQGPMLYLTIGGVIKVLLTILFVAIFQMGVTGVGLATIISWSVSCFLGVRALLKNTGHVKLKLNRLRFYKQELKEILIIGIPAGLQQALYSIANLAITKEVNKIGEFATTGLSIANNYDGILYQISTAPALAVMPYVSQNIGNNNVKRAKEAVIKCMFITVLLGATFGALSAIFSAQLSSIMASNPEIIKYSQQKMIIVSSTYFICGINDVIGSSLRGMGRSMVATVTTLIFMCAIRFPWVYFVYPLLGQNLSYLYLIWPIGWISSIITLLFFYFPTLKRIAKREGEALNNKQIS